MDKYRNVKWNKELEVVRDRNAENSGNFLSHRYEEEYPWQREKRNEVPVLRIICFSALGLVFVGFIFFGSGLMFTNGVINSIDNHLNNEAKTAQLAIEQRNKALAVELERLKAQKAEADLQRKQIEENNRLAFIQRQEAQRIKESKWKAYYKKPDFCSPPPTHQLRVECGNLYMRARAKFDELYSNGRI